MLERMELSLGKSAACTAAILVINGGLAVGSMETDGRCPCTTRTESLVKLTLKEIDLLSNISKARRQRKFFAWIIASVTFVALVALYNMDTYLDALIPALTAFFGIAVFSLAGDLLGVQTEDPVEDLLLKYVNNDPEALQQLSDRAKSREMPG